MHLLKFIKPIYVVFFVLILLIFVTVLMFSYFNSPIESKIDYSTYDSADTTSEISTTKADSEFTNSSARIDEKYFAVDNGGLFASCKKDGKAKIASDVLEINGITDKWIYVTTAASPALKSYLVRLSFSGREREVIVMGVEGGGIYNRKVDSVYFTNYKKKPIIISALKLITKEQRVIFRDYGIRLSGLLVFASDLTSEIKDDKVVLKLVYTEIRIPR